MENISKSTQELSFLQFANKMIEKQVVMDNDLRKLIKENSNSILA